MRLEGKIAGKISALLRLLGKIIDLLISVGDVIINMPSPHMGCTQYTRQRERWVCVRRMRYSV